MLLFKLSLTSVFLSIWDWQYNFYFLDWKRLSYSDSFRVRTGIFVQATWSDAYSSPVLYLPCAVPTEPKRQVTREPGCYMCFPRVQSLKFRSKKWMLPMFKKPQTLKGLTVNLVPGLFKQCSCVQIFCFFVERILMDSSFIFWNKFQDC